MALKGDRNELQTDISFFMTGAASRGVIVIHDTASTGSGAGMDQIEQNVKLPTNTGGVPAGLLLCDVVNYDLTRQPLNQHKDEVQVGSKVVLGKKGYWVTDQVSGTIVGNGQVAMFTTGGLIATTGVAGSSGTQVGRFLSAKDADGFAKVEINIV